MIENERDSMEKSLVTARYGSPGSAGMMRVQKCGKMEREGGEMQAGEKAEKRKHGDGGRTDGSY